MKKLILPAAALALLASGNVLAQQTLTDFISVTAEVTEACATLTATDVDFGADSARDTTDDATSTITVNCAATTNYMVEINYGVNSPGAGIRQVESTDPGLFMDYEIYQPGGFTTPWGLAADGAEYNGTGTGADDPLVANFRLNRTSGAEPGIYSDIVDVTLTF